jgi:hypothetical protein
MPDAMRLAQAPTTGAAKLTIVDMALQFPDQGVVVPGSSFFLADSGLACVRTISQWGEKLKKNKYESTAPYLQKAMMEYDPDGLFCFQMSKGGGIKEDMPMLLTVLKELETEAAGLGIIAEGKFPMFEHGTLCLFHKDHCVHSKVCHMEKYGSVPEWRARSQNPANLLFGIN